MSAAKSHAVFLSYASQDADAARRICEALRAAGVEVWFDQSELRGGDAWDAKIRKQIKECALFVPVISGNTQARLEGYFRLEWRLADQRSHLMAKGKPFLLPVVVDDTPDSDAHVPDSFLDVQWTRLTTNAAITGFHVRIEQLLGRGSEGSAPSAAPAAGPVARAKPRGARWRRVAVAALVFGAIAFGVWKWRAARTGLPASPADAATTSLARRAAQIVEDEENYSRAALELAEQFCQQAIARDPNDAEAHASYARVHAMLIYMSLDPSPERRTAAQKEMNLARRLAPDNDAVLLARSDFLKLSPATRPECEPLLRSVLARQPQNKYALRNLAWALRSLARTVVDDGAKAALYDEAVTLLRRSADLPGGDAVALVLLAQTEIERGRLDEAERMLDDALTRRPSPRMVRFRADLRVARGDLAGASALVEKLSPTMAGEPGFTAALAQLRIWERRPEDALRLLGASPADYFEDTYFTGPKEYWKGLALALQPDRQDAARVAWQHALRLVDNRLAKQPGAAHLARWKGVLLSYVGDPAEARRQLELAEQLEDVSIGVNNGRLSASAWLRLGDEGRALQAIRKWSTGQTRVHPFTIGWLRFDPELDALRNRPEYRAVLAEIEQRTGFVAQSVSSLQPKSVAVLAFDNLSDDKANEYFSDGISEELLDAIGKVPGLRVAGRTSSFSFKGKNVPEAEIARQLGVTHIVSGSVTKSGTDVHIRARLINGADGLQLWSDKFTREAKNIVALQDDIARRVAEQLQLKLGAPRVTRPVNPEAHSLLLEGRYFWNLRGADPESLARAEKALLGALKIDPAFPQAMAGLADVYVIRAWWAQMEGQRAEAAQDIARARQRATEALRLDDSLPEPHAALGTVHFLEGAFAEAEQAFVRSFQNNPGHAVARHWHSVLEAMQGRLDLALDHSRDSALADPRSPNTLWSLASIYNYARRHEDAVTAVERSLALRPGFLPALAEKAVASWFLGRKADAVAAARAIARDRTATIRWHADAVAIFVLRLAGHQVEAEEVAGHVRATVAPDDYRWGFALAALGKMEEAYAATVQVPTTAWGGIFYHRLWDQGRDDAGFLRMVERLGCAAHYKAAWASVERLGGAPKK